MIKTNQNNDLTDEALMKLFIQQQDQAAFSQVYKRYFSALSKYLAWLIGDREKGKDIAQNIFLKIYQNPQTFDVSKNFKVWVFSIAKNQWKNELRNESTRNKHHAFLKIEANQEAAKEIENEERLLQVQKALANLSEAHKEVFVLKYSNNLTIKEISQIYDCSEGTVKSRLFYALKQLKGQLNLVTIETKKEI